MPSSNHDSSLDDRRGPNRPANGERRPCPSCGGMMRFLEWYEVTHARVTVTLPVWVCSCGDETFVRPEPILQAFRKRGARATATPLRMRSDKKRMESWYATGWPDGLIQAFRMNCPSCGFGFVYVRTEADTYVFHCCRKQADSADRWPDAPATAMTDPKTRPSGTPMATPHESASGQEVLDPVCGMTDLPAGRRSRNTSRADLLLSAARVASTSSRRRPGQFITGRSAAAVATAPQPDDAREYTCPMDPEVRQEGPGACPKCGMALEPVIVAARRRRPSGPARCIPRSCATQPGLCPICGMALEPRTVTLEEREPRTRRHDAPLRWSLVSDGADSRLHGVGVAAGPAAAACASAGGRDWIAARAGDARRPVGRLAVLRSAAGRRS